MDTTSTSRRPLHAAVALSLLTLLAAAWIRGGVAATPYDTTDSKGRTMGFNDVFSEEHYAILLRNADWPHAVEQMNGDSSEWSMEGVYNWSLVAVHGIFLVMLTKCSARTIRWFLFVQPVFFFLGWFGFWFLPIEIVELLWAHTNDRESFVDIPYIAIMSQGAWFLACAFIFWKLRTGPSPVADHSLPIPA